MGERGPAPKDPSKRQRRNKPPEFEQLPERYDGEAPPLPGRSKYLKATRDWYDTWCSSPQAAGFGETDWQALAMMAPVVDTYWRSVVAGDPKLTALAMVKKLEKDLGATVADRQRLRWRLGSATEDTEPADEPAPTPQRRRRPRGGGRDARLRAV